MDAESAGRPALKKRSLCCRGRVHKWLIILGNQVARNTKKQLKVTRRLICRQQKVRLKNLLKKLLNQQGQGPLGTSSGGFSCHQGIQELGIQKLRFYDNLPTSWHCERTSRYLIDLFQHDLAGHCQALGKTFVFHIGNNLSENVRDRDLLRTFINTVTAMNALGRITGNPVGQVSAHADGVAESGGIRLIEHVQLVKHLETDGDRHIGRARHTVSTAGTTHLHQLPVGVGCLNHQLQFCTDDTVGFTITKTPPLP